MHIPRALTLLHRESNILGAKTAKLVRISLWRGFSLSLSRQTFDASFRSAGNRRIERTRGTAGRGRNRREYQAGNRGRAVYEARGSFRIGARRRQPNPKRGRILGIHRHAGTAAKVSVISACSSSCRVSFHGCLVSVLASRILVFRWQFCGRLGDDAVAAGAGDAFCGARGCCAVLRIAASTLNALSFTPLWCTANIVGTFP